MTSGISLTQRAFVFPKYGEYPSLQTNVTTPSLFAPTQEGADANPDRGEKESLNKRPRRALVRVHAASLNPIDKIRQSGGLRFLRPETKWPAVLGYDVSGVVVDKGSSTKFEVGDAVAARVNNSEGTVAEFAVVEDDTAVKIDATRISFEDAAAVGLAGQTALQAFRRGGVQKGDAVLITAGAGGVGTLAIQIAKQIIGCRFVGVTASGADKIQLCKNLGADLVIDYKNEAPLDSDSMQTKIAAALRPPGACDGADKFDFALDCTGEAAKLVAVVKPGGQVRTLSGPSPTTDSLREIGQEPSFLMRMLLWFLKDRKLERKAADFGVDWKFHFLLSNHVDQQKLLDAVELRKLKVVIDSVHPLENAGKAWEQLVSGRSKGKVVVKVL
ncbi:unnamed protein product [Amoebophrya sp. A120]|nr:unnamed protein product [Amoebophrya sp. A120]|eukprot:GSA120T00017398001.1